MDHKTLTEVQALLKTGMPLSVVAKTLNIPMSMIEHLKCERGNNSE